MHSATSSATDYNPCILTEISFVVRSFVRSFVSARLFFLYRTAVQFCCICAVDEKADHGHKEGHAPRALHGALIHGHLKAA